MCCDFSYFRERAMTVSISFVPETAYAQGEQLHVHVYHCCKLLTTGHFSVSAFFTYTQAH